MCFRRGGNHHGINIVSRQDLMKGHAYFDTRVLFLKYGQNRFIPVTNEPQIPKLIIISNQILAPVPGTDDSYSLFVRHGFSPFEVSKRIEV
jgi:hypothetical protein